MSLRNHNPSIHDLIPSLVYAETQDDPSQHSREGFFMHNTASTYVLTADWSEKQDRWYSPEAISYPKRAVNSVEYLIDGRATFASQAIAHMREDARQARDTARRHMVKELEHLELDGLERQLFQRSKWPALSSALRFRPRWHRRLRARVARRAAALGDALERISGVYMPNRSHATRVAVKKLRYGVEIAGETGFWQVPGVVKALRRAQSTLGASHALQVLVDRAEQRHPDGGDAREWAWLRDLLQADIANQHRSFIERRERLEAAVRACVHWARPVSVRWPTRSFVVLPLAASAAVVPFLAKSRR